MVESSNVCVPEGSIKFFVRFSSDDLVEIILMIYGVGYEHITHGNLPVFMRIMIKQIGNECVKFAFWENNETTGKEK